MHLGSPDDFNYLISNTNIEQNRVLLLIDSVLFYLKFLRTHNRFKINKKYDNMMYLFSFVFKNIRSVTFIH